MEDRNLKNYRKLLSVIEKIPFEAYNRHSRIHAMRMLQSSEYRVFVKREDELSFSISGVKIRKYLSLLPFIKASQIEEAILIGGAYSNNVLGITQLLIENGIAPIALLRKMGRETLSGNHLFLRMLISEESIIWVDRNDWSKVEEMAAELSKMRKKKSLVIPEGSFLPEALPGVLTLSTDILRNEIEQGIAFDHIFIDAGTGVQAIALILGHSWIGRDSTIHVVLLAENEEAFRDKLIQLQRYFSRLMGEEMPFPNNFCFHRPHSGRSFGSMSSEVFREIKATASQEGFFLDPIYSGKLFLTGKKLLQMNSLKGNILFVHSGGALTLSGFQEKMKNYCTEL